MDSVDERMARMNQEVLSACVTLQVRPDAPLTPALASAVTAYIAHGKTENRFILELRARRQARYSERQLTIAAQVMREAFEQHLSQSRLLPQYQQDGTLTLVPAPEEPAVSLVDLARPAAPVPDLLLPAPLARVLGAYSIGTVTVRVRTLDTQRIYRGMALTGVLERLLFGKFIGIGWVCGEREVFIWGRTDLDEPLVGALAAFADAGDDERRAMGGAYAVSSCCCYRCGRALTAASSIDAGLGPICAEKAWG